VLGYSPLGTGLRVLPWTATPMLVAPVAGMLADRVGQRPMMVAGVLLQGVGLAWLALAATSTTGYAPLVLPLILAGVGISMALPAVPTAALGAVRPSDMGKASGANSTLQRFGGVFGIAIATAVFAANGHLGTAASFSSGFRPALLVSAAFSVLGAFSALAVRRRRPVPARATAEEPIAA
jgi:MFS family permease